jgi:dienelactone hydrolase
MRTNCDLLPGFDYFRFAATSGEARCVYHVGKGPAVLIMHEVTGLDPACVKLAEEIAASGFTAYLPLLFGRLGQPGVLPAMSMCVRREFFLFAAGKRSPITNWLRDLCTHVHTLRGGPGIGLIGMCLTGGFVFALCASPAVLAAVSCQPSLPFSLFRNAKFRKDLGTAPADLDSAKTRVRAEGVDILGFRYSSDPLCPAERFEAAELVFGDRFKPTTYPTPDRKHGLPRWAHSVLTGRYAPDQPESHPVRRARREVIGYLRERLLPATA